MSERSGVVFVGSWNAGPASDRAAGVLRAGTRALLDAIVEGIGLVEDDPEELSVGFGGLPNEEGVVELDAAVMDGALHKAGAVAGLRGVRRAAALALDVLRRTDHALLVGDGALKFARQLGYKEEDLLTPKARDAWLAWKASLSPRDAWISPADEATDFGGAQWAGHAANPTPGGPPELAGDGKTPAPTAGPPSRAFPFTHGTVHLSGRDAAGNLAACTSTSGLSYKIPGRAGDTPVIGAGIFVDNSAGSAGCTGRGEASLHNCAAYEIVRLMESGRSATEACLGALGRIAARTKEKRLLSRDGRPAFNVTVYALRADGDAGSAAMHAGYTYITHRAGRTTLEPCAALFGEKS